MNRLTDKNTTKRSNDTWDLCGLDNVCKRDCWKPTPCKIPNMVYRLAEYEDTGLTPAEVAELAQAKADGRVVVLPCAENTIVYRVVDDYTCDSDCWGDTCNDCEAECKKKFREVRKGRFSFIYDGKDFGKTVFLTREEAEKALKESDKE